MRWLQWASFDLKGGLGGVEVHARCLARELSGFGIEAVLSSDLEDLAGDWDIIHTHGSSPLPIARLKELKFRPRRPILVHTLHGTTIGRMAACREWAWPGGYLASVREIGAVLRADVVLSVEESLWLYRLARKLGKQAAICGNGWDAGSAEEPLPQALNDQLANNPRWLFIGRGKDPVKGASLLLPLLKQRKSLHLAAVPGDGFVASEQIVLTGELTAEQVRRTIKQSRGLLIPSRYEGYSLVGVEALAQGVPVVSTRVGIMSSLSKQVQGLTLVDSFESHDFAQAVERAESSFGMDASSREERSAANRAVLMTWNDVARIALTTVRAFKG